jgi:NADH dehydrogenase
MFMNTNLNTKSPIPGSKIVILGAGFAGLNLAQKLAGTAYDITIIDKYNFHQFQPLFYQVATARLEPSAISFPLRKVFQRKKNVHVRNTNVTNIDTGKQQVHTDDGVFQYDYLVIATGCSTNYFGNQNIARYAYAMKSTTEAIALRNRILLNFEEALNATPEELEALMNIVVVGGGPTGVEMAGSLAEMKKYVLPRDYPDMDFSGLNIYLLEGGPYTLGAMSKPSQQKSQEYLERLGVHVWVNTIVQDYDGRKVILKDGREIISGNMIWAAGVTGNVPQGVPADAVTKANRITVNEYCRVRGLKNVYAIGDIAYMETPAWPKGHPQLANVATNSGIYLGNSFRAILKGATQKPFVYKNPGTMATVGKRKAVVDLPSVSFQGFAAWFFWMALHLMLILSVRNKFMIFVNWAISYFTNDTTLRLILLPTRKQVELGIKHHAIEKED